MNILIFKTNIKSPDDFFHIQKYLSKLLSFEECTIDLEDDDKVMRVISNQLTIERVAGEVTKLGFFCEELAG